MIFFLHRGNSDLEQITMYEFNKSMMLENEKAWIEPKLEQGVIVGEATWIMAQNIM